MPALLAALAALLGLIARAIAVPTVRVFDEQRAGDRLLLFEVREGGEPLGDAHRDDALLLGSPSRQTREGPFADPKLQVWAYLTAKGGGACDEALEAAMIALWVGGDPRVAPRPAPSITLHSPRTLDPERALLLDASE